MLLELTLAILAILIAWDYLHKKQTDAFLAKSNISGPKALPILGNSLRLRNVNTENIEAVLKENTATYGKIYRFWVFNQMHLRVTDPKLCEALLSSQHQITKSSFYEFLIDWLGRGLLLSNGKKWHTRRKIITPAFHFKILEQFVEVFDQQSTVMAKNLLAQADGQTAIDMFPVVCRMALDTISETAMGVKVHAQENQEFEYVKALNYVSTVMSKRFVNPSQRTSFLFKLTSPKVYRETQRCIGVMHRFTTQVIEKRRQALEKSMREASNKADPPSEEEDEDEYEHYGRKQRMAFLDILLQSTVDGEPLSNEDIREEVDTFMFEGHDTTTSGISFALYLIARHPEVQARLFEEICQIVGQDPDKVLSYRDLQDMKYLECVIKESLRLFPPVPAIGREITEDVQLGDVTLPANTNVVLSFSLIMRNPDYFPEPDAFRPDRFFGDGDSKSHVNPFLYTPFSAGPRNCIGQRFAMLEMKSVITKMLLHFELLPLGPEVQRLTTIVLRSKTGAHIGLRPRCAK
ncbi:cytochrome P450 4d2 [Musca domestica]|uniref:Cytochrome P450 4d2 n=1 Tax=Musca domestica TaxID=7370 RepID=A0A9J7CLU1_MUSDO|nr:cytochrome P450 4d2 [Musca domestica]